MVAEQTKARTKTSLPSPTATKQKVVPGRTAAGAAGQRARRGAPMGMAVMAAALLVALLCVYVYAYARVTTAGFELSRLSRALRQAEQEEEALRAEISRLSLPSAVERRAQVLGMTPAPAEAAQVLTAAPEDRARVVAQRGE
jgi:cell division protein FtsB